MLVYVDMTRSLSYKMIKADVKPRNEVNLLIKCLVVFARFEDESDVGCYKLAFGNVGDWTLIMQR